MKLKNMSSIAVLAIVGLAFAAGGTVLRANLIGVGKGKVTWKVKDIGNEHQAELSAESERLRPNSSYTVTIGTNSSITVSTNAFGAFSVDQRFTTLSRPNIRVGDVVTVVDAGGATVQSGSMQ